MLFAQIAKPDPGLADKTAAGEVDPRAHHRDILHDLDRR
jgi:hypothetical protein